jgi:hypothetical protein
MVVTAPNQIRVSRRFVCGELVRGGGIVSVSEEVGAAFLATVEALLSAASHNISSIIAQG